MIQVFSCIGDGNGDGNGYGNSDGYGCGYGSGGGLGNGEGHGYGVEDDCKLCDTCTLIDILGDMAEFIAAKKRA